MSTNPFPSDSPLYFATWERPAFFSGQGEEPEHYEDPSHKHIVRMLDGAPISIGVVGRNWFMIPMRALCEAIQDTFVEMLNDEELKDAEVIPRLSHSGAKLYADYRFPNVRATVGGTDDVGFRCVLRTGYDGSQSVTCYTGAISFICSNGMISGQYNMLVKKHTKGFSLPDFTAYIRTSIDVFYKQAEIWRKWYGKQVTKEQAKELFEAIPGISPRRVEQLLRQYHIEVLTHGETVWAVYNAATYYASHSEGEFAVRDTGGDHLQTTLHNRETEVMHWTQTEAFKAISDG